MQVTSPKCNLSKRLRNKVWSDVRYDFKQDSKHKYKIWYERLLESWLWNMIMLYDTEIRYEMKYDMK